MTTWPAAIDLAGTDWQFGSVPPTPLWHSSDLNVVQEWLPAAVPGNLESDLLAAGRIPDPTVGCQNETGRWVEHNDWWYRSTVHVPRAGGQRAHLVMHGVDYYSAVYANGVLLGQHEGMFSPQVYEVTRLLRDSDGNLDLAVRLWGAHALPARRLSLAERLAEPVLRLISGDADMFPARIQTTKCQMSFGWDFAPKLPTIGIWDDAEIVVSGPVFISDISVKATLRGSSAADVELSLLLDSSFACPAEAVVTVQAANFDGVTQKYTEPLDLAQGAQTRTITLSLPSPRIWQPWDRGEPSLYDLTVSVQPAVGARSSAAATFGIRTVELEPLTGPDVGWTLRVNGNREFLRGVNWVPASILPGCVRAEDYATLLGMAHAANANTLRVWGGGLREKRAFYDQCDRAGLLVWQEFPFACPNLARYPTDDRFLAQAEQEATSIVRDLRNHPSVVLWCGGNEFGPAKNKPLVQRLQRVVNENDGSRPFLPASPARGDSHDWTVWHHLAPLSAYVKATSPVVSEFGVQSLPGLESLEAFLPSDDLWPPGPAWLYHNAELNKLRRYAATFAPTSALPDFVRGSQLAQARAVQIMVEHVRRRKSETGGVMVWQLNEPWPSICWSLIGHDRRPKLAYHMLQRVFNPLLVSVEYPFRRYRPGDVVDLKLWVVCDGACPPVDAALTLHLTLNGADVHVQAVRMRADSSDCVGMVKLRLPEQKRPWLLRAELRQGKGVLAENEYDLSYFDAQDVPLLHRLLALAGRWLLR